MPELPEVETIRRSLLPHLRGRVITQVTVRQPALRERVDAVALRRCLTGQRIVDIHRRAKYLLFHLASQHALVIHLGMTGRLLIEPASRPANQHDHLLFHLDDGRQLRFHDVRRFGMCFVVANGSLAGHPRFRHLGVEPFDAASSPDYFVRRARGGRKPVKNFLMDGTVVVGVGNIYANEALFVAGVNPKTAAGRIRRARWERICAALRNVLEDAIDKGGTSFSNYVDGEGRKGYFALELRVYGRAGEPCKGCGNQVRRIIQAGRSTFYCTRCQH